jgi:hypothetical protein
MFDLERAVAEWIATVHARGCRADEDATELADHLYCEIDRARATGLGDEEAFAAAVARLGTAVELGAEHGKNRRLAGLLCRYSERLDPSASPEQRRLLLGHAWIWAALMIASALVMAASEARDHFVILLTTVLVPLWWASDRLLRRALRTVHPLERWPR